MPEEPGIGLRARQLGIKASLPKTWPVFFSRHGKLFPVQDLAIPLLLAGRNVTICAPTATGKTEAAVAPICERILAAPPPDGVRCVYLCPTRALVNDIEARLREPLRELGIPFTIKTGDRPLFHPGKPAAFVVTTPESLDSLISRHPDLLRGLEWAVLDEIHMLDATPRGDHLRSLCRRLPPSTRFVAMSATLAQPLEVTARYFSDFETVLVHHPREIEAEWLSADDWDRLRRRFLERGIRKAILFCATRRQVEETAALLRERRVFPPERVYTHHGSLSRVEREGVEQAMREERMGFVVATMTLEFGIDIGDVDAIVLNGVPDSVSSFLQRIGRGNRRTGKSVVFGLCRAEGEAEILNLMLEAARQGKSEAKDYAPFRSVIVQQLFSMTHQGVPAERQRELLNRLGLGEVEEILAHLIAQGYLVERGGQLGAGEPLAEMAERGEIHSNVSDSLERWDVVDRRTLAPLGEAPCVRPARGEVILVGGRNWMIVNTDPRERKIFVRELADGDARARPYARRRDLGAFFRLLPPRLQEEEQLRHACSA